MEKIAKGHFVIFLISLIYYISSKPLGISLGNYEEVFVLVVFFLGLEGFYNIYRISQKEKESPSNK